MSLTLRITGITKMSNDRICMSGYNIDQNKYYRPILDNRRSLTNCFLNQNKGQIKLFSLVTFKQINIHQQVERPHIEDMIVNDEVINIVNDLNDISDQNNFLRNISDKSVEDVFGDFIDSVDDHPVVLDGCGKRSLGTIISPKCTLVIDSSGNTRVTFIDETGFQLSNVKCVSFDKKYSIPGVYENIPIRISLSRRWKRPNDDEYYYWIQVSGVFPS